MLPQCNHRCQASILLRQTRSRVPLDLCAHCTNAEFVRITISISDHLTSVVSVYVRTGVPWDSLS